MRVALVVTCINDAMFPDTRRRSLLRRLGVDVPFPAGQTCCAQPMVNTGYLDEAVPVARTFVQAIEGDDAVVTPPGSCPATARHQQDIVARRSGDSGLSSAVAALPRVHEPSEFLVECSGWSTQADPGTGPDLPDLAAMRDLIRRTHGLRRYGPRQRPRMGGRGVARPPDT